jgi:sialidase-1
VDREGTIHLVFSRNNARAFYTKSVDDGATFSVPREITDAFRAFSFEWTRLASGPGHGIQSRSGRMIVPVWLNDRIGHNYRSAVLYSDDSGSTWTAGGIVKPTLRDCNECMAVERADGSLLLNMRNKSAKCRAVAFSTDGGITWTEPRLIEELVDPVCQASIVRFSSSKSGRKSRILFCNAASRSRDHMTVKLSYDEGDSWPITKLIHAGPSAYSDLAITRDMTILCLFEKGAKRPYEKLTVARFNLDWVTKGKEESPSLVEQRAAGS